MSSTLAPPAPPTAPSPPITMPPRRRRWPTVLVLALVVMLLGGLIFVEGYVAHYKPLGNAYVWFEPHGAHHLGSFSAPQSGDSFDAYVSRCRVGVPFQFGFGLINSGRVGITVTSLFQPQDKRDVLYLTDPRVGPGTGNENNVFNGPRTPFKPFSLAPHQFRVIEMSAVFTACQPGTMGINSSEMSFRVLGQTQTQLMPFPFDLDFTRSGKLET